MTSAWRTVGAVAPEQLVEARLQAHHAAQIVSAVGLTLLAPRSDDSHPNLGWSAEAEALVGRCVDESSGLRAALNVPALRLALLDGDGTPQDELALDGMTFEQALGWLEGRLAARLGELPPGGLRRTTYEIPDHAVAHGAAFAPEPAEAFAELAHWLADGQISLGDLAARMEGAPEVRVWPHHFDAGLLSVVASDAQGNATQTIGAGLSPGDAQYAEPYWYVSPWPYPERADALPPLSAGGHWHTAGFTSAILTGSELVAGDPATQRERVTAFLDDAVAASRRVLSH